MKKELGKNFDAEIKEKKNDSKRWPSSRGRGKDVGRLGFVY